VPIILFDTQQCYSISTNSISDSMNLNCAASSPRRWNRSGSASMLRRSCSRGSRKPHTVADTDSVFHLVEQPPPDSLADSSRLRTAAHPPATIVACPHPRSPSRRRARPSHRHLVPVAAPRRAGRPGALRRAGRKWRGVSSPSEILRIRTATPATAAAATPAVPMGYLRLDRLAVRGN
jgi:hypothetical protein